MTAVHRLLAALLMTLAALVLAPAAVAETEPQPDAPAGTGVPGAPAGASAGVPDAVAEWFRTQAPGVVSAQAAAELGLDAAQRESLSLGTVRPVMWWSPELLAGTELDDPVVPTERWAAPLQVAGVGVGVLFAETTTAGADMQATFSDRQTLAESLLVLAPDVPIVHDLPLDAWFTVDEGEVRPLDEAARETLAGSAPLDVYQPFVAARYERFAETDAVEPGSAAPTEPSRSWAPAAWVAGVLVLVLSWAAVVVWLRRPESGEPEAVAGPRRAPPRRPSRGARR